MSKSKQFSETNLTLTPAVFYILLSLSKKPAHGYEIMKQVKVDSNDKVNLGPGTLYGAIKRLLEERLISETQHINGEERRRYYELTDKGRQALSSELERFNQAVDIAKKWNILPDLKLEVSI